jgi:hypothetical protein
MVLRGAHSPSYSFDPISHKKNRKLAGAAGDLGGMTKQAAFSAYDISIAIFSHSG